ncbi:hypothetical protein ABIB25_003852 [Nakamurella sp. UYEF19]
MANADVLGLRGLPPLVVVSVVVVLIAFGPSTAYGSRTCTTDCWR